MHVENFLSIVSTIPRYIRIVEKTIIYSSMSVFVFSYILPFPKQLMDLNRHTMSLLHMAAYLAAGHRCTGLSVLSCICDFGL
jgi:hypothetical protein